MHTVYLTTEPNGSIGCRVVNTVLGLTIVWKGSETFRVFTHPDEEVSVFWAVPADPNAAIQIAIERLDGYLRGEPLANLLDERDYVFNGNFWEAQ